MADSFMITGTRPPSATGVRPVIASSKDFGYYTKAVDSSVDETLFQSHHTSTLQAPVPFTAPWERNLKGKDHSKKKTKPGRPLLWAPAPSGADFNSNSGGARHSFKFSSCDTNRTDDTDNSSHKIKTLQGVPLKHQYHRLKHTPTFVDESLFGDPLLESSFKAPWEEKKKKVKQSLNWYPDQQAERRPVRRRRPATALGLRGYSATSGSVPVWKP